jgi:uncharacterized membrane protein YjjP (DUF1212 family)
MNLAISMINFNQPDQQILLLKFITAAAGCYQGYRMTKHQKKMKEIFEKWAFYNAEIRVFGWMTIGACLLIFVPVVGLGAAVVVAASMFMAMGVEASVGNLKFFFLQLPFFFLNICLVLLQIPAPA